MGLFAKIFGTDNDRQIKKLEVIASKVEALSDLYAGMTDKELTNCTKKFKIRLSEGETLDDVLPDAYACVREASTRVIGLRHFHVQILGGIALHQGRIAEMCTGEGKTLVETLPAYLNALTGKGVHIVTVNDYLAKRDAEWMGQIYKFLGLSVGVITNQQPFDEKKQAYNCDITYGTNSAFGFDFLRDNQVRNASQMVQRDLNFVIIDEVDSVLIDEARTPLIISGKNKKSSEGFYSANSFAKTLKEPNPDSQNEDDRIGDFEINEEDKKIVLTERGTAKAEAYFKVDNIGDYENMDLYRNIRLAIRANFLMKKDRDYVVKDNQVIIVDEFTGRLQIGRRFNDGLHTAIEAKENIRIKDENQVIATITYQNLFRMYRKISGMTGTAKTEEEEFRNIYGLDIVVIPTNKPVMRIDENDLIYKTREAKLRAVVEDIKNCYQKGQPVLVGTVSVEKSEELSNMLYRERIPHNVLNAKNHEREAEIVAQAGRKGSVTIATNMAGRGTDIKLGGNSEFMAKQYLAKCKYSEKVIAEATSQSKDSSEDVMKVRELYLSEKAKYDEQTDKEKAEVLALGGLRIIGTERHESRRIDNQLRGRSGRQGDVGSSVFYISFEDDLIRIFAGDRLKSLAQSLALPDDMPISMKMITNKVEDAQKKIESRNYSIRKNVLAYDDVMNKQREIIYSDRRKMLYDKTFYQENYEILRDTISSCLAKIDFSENSKNINIDNLNRYLVRELLQRDDWTDYEYSKILTREDIESVDVSKLVGVLSEKAIKYYKKLLADYLDLLDKDVYTDAVKLTVDFSKSVEDWDYKKLNSIIRNHLPSTITDDLFTVDDAKALQTQNKLAVEYVVNAVKDKLCVILSDIFAKYDEQIISNYVLYTLEKEYKKYGLDEEKMTTALNSGLSADHQIVLTKQDLLPDYNLSFDAAESVYLEEADKNYKKISVEILDEVLSIFLSKLPTSPYDWDFKKVDRDFCSILFPKNSSGVPIVSGIISVRLFNKSVIDSLSAIATNRIEKIYENRFGDSARSILDRLNESNGTLSDYIKSLLLTRVDLEESATKWDFYRMTEVLGFNCLQKEDENSANTLLTKDDFHSVEKFLFLLDVKTTVLAAYRELLGRMKANCNKFAITRALKSVSVNQSLKTYNEFLKNKLLPKELFGEPVELIGEDKISSSVEEKTSVVYDRLRSIVGDKTDELNLHILEYIVNFYSTKGVSTTDVVEKLTRLLPLTDSGELAIVNKDAIRVSQTLSTVDRAIKNQKAAELKAIEEKSKEVADKILSGEIVEVIDEKTVESVKLKSLEEKAVSRTCGAYRSHRDEKSILNDRNQEEIYSLIELTVKNVLDMQNGEYYSWNIPKINGILTYALLPISTPVELLATYFTKRDVSDVVIEKITDKAYEKISPIFEEIIEKSKKEGYRSAHEHILKWLPEVVAEVVADNVDFGIDINDWDYDEINSNLRERIVPDLDESVELVDEKIASEMNIDAVIDAVVDKVIDLFNKKAVSYNLDLIQDFILDEVKDYVDRRQPIENYDYRLLNRRFARVFLAPVDRDRELLSEDFLRSYLDEGKMSLSYYQAAKAVRDSLEKVYLERIDVYNRFVHMLCYKKAKPSATFGDFERYNLLSYTDKHWFDHIDNMERLRVGIGLRALGQQNPITCYQSEGFQLFDEMIGLIHEDVVIHSLKDEPSSIFGKKEESVSDRFSQKNKKTVYYKQVGARPTVRTSKKIGPNDPCPCGSGKKYKKCCMNKKVVAGGWSSFSDDDK